MFRVISSVVIFCAWLFDAWRCFFLDRPNLQENKRDTLSVYTTGFVKKEKATTAAVEVETSVVDTVVQPKWPLFLPPWFIEQQRVLAAAGSTKNRFAASTTTRSSSSHRSQLYIYHCKGLYILPA